MKNMGFFPRPAKKENFMNLKYPNSLLPSSNLDLEIVGRKFFSPTLKLFKLYSFTFVWKSQEYF